MKLTLPDGSVVETSDPMVRVALLQLQEALEGFRQSVNGEPDDPGHAAYAELVAETRAAAERSVRAFDALREVLAGLGVSEANISAFAASAMIEVRARLGEGA